MFFTSFNKALQFCFVSPPLSKTVGKAVISHTARWCLWQSQSSVMKLIFFVLSKELFCMSINMIGIMHDLPWLLQVLVKYVNEQLFNVLCSYAHDKNYSWAITRSLLWALLVYYNKVIKDFMIVLLAKDQYDFYQVCNYTILDGLPSLNYMKGDTFPLSYVQRFSVQLGHHLKPFFFAGYNQME